MSQHQASRPPTADEVNAHLLRHQPRGPSRWVTWMPMIALTVVLALMLTTQGVMSFLTGCLIVLGIMTMTQARMRMLRHLEGRVVQSQELAMLRYFDPALRLTWEILPEAVGKQVMRSRIVYSMAQSLDHLKAYDAAIVAYNDLINQLPRDHPGTVQLSIQRTIAQLQANHLADADDTLRRLRGVAEVVRDSATAAAFRLAQLLQRVRTNHYADAISFAHSLLDDLRPLGVEAAYGHALMALSFHCLQEPDAKQQAQLWWSRAQLLMPAAAIVERFDELKQLIEIPPAAGDKHL